MKVYRFENEKGYGPYTGSYGGWTEDNHNDAIHPAPLQGCEYPDYQLIEQLKRKKLSLYSCYFGFTSMKQLKKWFSKSERESLKELGFEIKVFNAKKYAKSKYQVAFQRKGGFYD